MGPDDDDHPLLLELTSLRQTAARFQHEAHAAAIKLQRHSLDLSCLHEYTASLEQENARLTRELGILRAHPEIPHHPAEAQAQELSLALRRVSDKVTLTEDVLLRRTSELTDARSELMRARLTADGAYELAARMRAREEASKARERELELKLRASEEELKMVDIVVQEYADLVRNLEGRKSVNHTLPFSNGSSSTITLVDNLQDGKSSLHKMLTAFSTESGLVHATISELSAKVSDLQMTLDAQRITASHDRALLSESKTELDKLILEDQTAAKMVTRYMKFSQASTNALQEQLTTLRVRHSSTIATLELQLSITESQLASERARTARLQDALDELCEDLARESYGRRREVALRLALLSREEGVAEFMRRWVKRARELYARCYQRPAPPFSSEDVQEAFHRVVSDAESLLSALDDDVQFSDDIRTSGPLARITLSREAVEALRQELQDELRKRVEAVRKSASSLPGGHPDGTGPRIESLSQPGSTPSLCYDGPPGHLLLTPNDNGESEHETPPVSLSPPQDVNSPVSMSYDGPSGHLLLTRNDNAGFEHETPPVSLSPPRDGNSPVSMVASPVESIGDPLVVPATVSPPISKITEPTIIQGEVHSLPSPSIQDSASTSAMLLAEEKSKTVQPRSPAISMLDLLQDPQSSNTEESLTVDVVPIYRLPDDISASPPLEDNQNVQVLAENDNTPTPSTSTSILVPTTQSAQALGKDDTFISLTPISTPTPAVSHVALVPSNSPPTLLSELGSTKHRYDTLQRAFRDCSLALKELKRTIATLSLPSYIHPKLRQHLETALARIDDYSEDARVELEIRVSDEELTVRGFETVLSVPGALVDVDERAEVEASARGFVDGTDEDVAKALEKFARKLEDVQHDVAVVKRAVHGLAMSEEDEERRGEGVDSKDGGATWTTWTAGFLGANATPSRSPTPVQTFGAVMTSPRLRHAASLKQLQAQASMHESPDREPLARLSLRIPIPSPSHLPSVFLGLGRTMEGPNRPRTLSGMYAMGGLRSSSVGLGVGLGGSPSPARTRGMAGRLEGGRGLGGGLSPLRGGASRGEHASNARGTKDGELHGLGDVE